MFEHGSNSWNGIKVRKNGVEGVVVKDWNAYRRILTVDMENGIEETITMNNMGRDPESVHDWEWLDDRGSSKEHPEWYRF